MISCNKEHFSPALDTGVGGPDLLFFVVLDRPYAFPPFTDTGVWRGLLTISVYPGLALHSLDSASQEAALPFLFIG